MRKCYSSGISKEGFQLILPGLESACKKTNLHKIDIYDVFCVVYYVLNSFLMAYVTK